MGTRKIRAILTGTLVGASMVLAGTWSTLARAESRIEVDVTGANIRDRPGKGGRVVAKGIEGERMSVTGTQGDWIGVSLSNGQTGFIHQSVVHRMGTTGFAAQGSATGAPEPTSNLTSRDVSSRIPVPVPCNQYRLNWIASPGGILVSLLTDLPNEVPVELIVDRQVTDGAGVAQRVVYYKESTTVGGVRALRRVPLDDDAWAKRAARATGASMEGGVDSSAVSADSRIRVQVRTPARFPDSRRSTHEFVLQGRPVQSGVEAISGSTFPVPSLVASTR